MLMMPEEVPPGAPTVDRAGPALPALLMKMTLCLFTTCTRHAKHHVRSANPAPPALSATSRHACRAACVLRTAEGQGKRVLRPTSFASCMKRPALGVEVASP